MSNWIGDYFENSFERGGCGAFVAFLIMPALLIIALLFWITGKIDKAIFDAKPVASGICLFSILGFLYFLIFVADLPVGDVAFVIAFGPWALLISLFS